MVLRRAASLPDRTRLLLEKISLALSYYAQQDITYFTHLYTIYIYNASNNYKLFIIKSLPSEDLSIMPLLRIII